MSGNPPGRCCRQHIDAGKRQVLTGSPSQMNAEGNRMPEGSDEHVPEKLSDCALRLAPTGAKEGTVMVSPAKPDFVLLDPLNRS